MPTKKLLTAALTTLACLAAGPSALAAVCEDCELPPTGGGGGGGSATYATPDTRTNAASDSTTKNPRPTVSFSATLASVRYQCLLAPSADSGWVDGPGVTACGTSAAIGTTAHWTPTADLADGTHHLQVRACKDYAETTRCDLTPVKRTFTVDTVAPVAGFSGLADGAAINTPTTVGVSNSEIGWLGCMVDPGIEEVFDTCGTSRVVGRDGLTQGPRSLVIKAYDKAGNTSGLKTLRFVWDTVRPTVGDLVASGVTTARPSVAYATADATSGVSSVSCRLTGDGGFQRYEECSKNAWTSETDLADGEYTLHVIAEDAAGNTSLSASHVFAIDTMAPTLSPIAFDEAARKLLFTVSGNDVAPAITCILDDGGEKDCTSPFDVSDLAPGEHALTVKVRDGFGNATSAFKVFTIPGAAKPPVADGGGGVDVKTGGGKGSGATATSSAAATQPNGSATASTPAAASGPRTVAAAPPAAKKAATKRACFKTRKVRGKKKRAKVPCAKRAPKKRAAKKRR